MASQTPPFIRCICGQALRTVCVSRSAAAPMRAACDFMHMWPRE